MCFIGGNLGAGTTAFVKELTNPGLVPTICTVLGFSYVMEYTKCTEHMVYFISAGLKKMTKIIIPGAVIITFLINIALPTAAGCAAAVGALLIPALIRSGVHPAMAGSAIFLGTWGSSLSPGLMFNPQRSTASRCRCNDSYCKLLHASHDWHRSSRNLTKYRSYY